MERRQNSGRTPDVRARVPDFGGARQEEKACCSEVSYAALKGPLSAASTMKNLLNILRTRSVCCTSNPFARLKTP